MSTELRNCPFCGGEPKNAPESNYVECSDCGGGAYFSEWQQRPQLDEAIEALEKIVDEGESESGEPKVGLATQSSVMYRYAKETLSNLRGERDD